MSTRFYGQHRDETPIPSTVEKACPDHALFLVTLAVSDLAATPALTLLKDWAGRLEKAVPLAAPASTVAAVDFDPPTIPALLKSGDESSSRLVLHVTVPLSNSAAFFERAARVAAVDDALRELVLQGRKNKPSVLVTRNLPVFLVSEAALVASRERLLARWQSRLQDLARFAALNVEGVWPAIDVTQKSVSVEEVELRFEPGGQATLRMPRHPQA